MPSIFIMNKYTVDITKCILQSKHALLPYDHEMATHSKNIRTNRHSPLAE